MGTPQQIAGSTRQIIRANEPSGDVFLVNSNAPVTKMSFLVFKNNKYITVSTQTIAYFYVKYESSVIVCFDGQEYFIKHSLEQVQIMVSGRQFFRLNRQYLINFSAIKEAEHYFARKLLVTLTVAVSDKLLITKEKVTPFLQWLDNR